MIAILAGLLIAIAVLALDLSWYGANDTAGQLIGPAMIVTAGLWMRTQSRRPGRALAVLQSGRAPHPSRSDHP